MPILNKKQLINRFKYLMSGTTGIQGLITEETIDIIIDRIIMIEKSPLTKVQLNQLILLNTGYGMSDGFFEYYWLKAPQHFYDVNKIQCSNYTKAEGASIFTINQYFSKLSGVVPS